MAMDDDNEIVHEEGITIDRKTDCAVRIRNRLKTARSGSKWMNCALESMLR